MTQSESKRKVRIFLNTSLSGHYTCLKSSYLYLAFAREEESKGRGGKEKKRRVRGEKQQRRERERRRRHERKQFRRNLIKKKKRINTQGREEN